MTLQHTLYVLKYMSEEWRNTYNVNYKPWELLSSSSRPRHAFPMIELAANVMLLYSGEDVFV